MITDQNRQSGIGFTNSANGYLELQGASLKRISLDGFLVVRLGAPSLIEWLVDCLQQKRVTRPEFWSGLRFDDSKLSMDIAITLLVSKVAAFS